MLKTIVIFSILIFWPLSLYLSNTQSNFLSYFIPTSLLVFSFFLYIRKGKYYLYPILAVPLIEPKLAFIPLVFLILKILISQKKKNLVFPFIVSLIVVLSVFQSFYGQTIFVTDYEAQQKVIRDTHLYNSVFLARMFHNKAAIISGKFLDNFFALTDPNNYFFGFHPRQMVGNQNLIKFPALSILFFLYALYYIKKYKYKQILFLIITVIFLNLSVLSIFDRNDFILWFPISSFVVFGVNEFDKLKYHNIFYIIFIAYSLIEIIRIFI